MEHKANHLINESSPYLLQHAYNPVDWHPWSESALNKAKSEDKLLIISIGYAACHWCHVMEHESFEDSAVAKIMNDHFIPIKVDREERPDIDNIYMDACQLASGRACGWPLNAFALPDGRPVWAGTYFPKKNWIKILEHFVNLKESDDSKLEEYASQLMNGIQSMDKISIPTETQLVSDHHLLSINHQILGRVDWKNGGNLGAPKFPLPIHFEFLLTYGHLYQQDSAIQAVTQTLNQMANGGIYDQIGGGFARYSTDAEWKVPHFEKMLYDNGQLISLYAQAYRKTQNPLYEKVVKASIDFVKRELWESPYFYASLDADSEGEEGTFYVWTDKEFDELLSDEVHRDIMKSYYGIKLRGNWESHKNVLYIEEETERIARRLNKTVEEIEDIISKSNQILFAHRAKRERPGLDDKSLTSWNALMSDGLLNAYEALGNQEYLDMATLNLKHLTSTMMESDGRLWRNYKGGKKSVNGFLDDYAFTIKALLKTYENTFDIRWLEYSQKLIEYVLTHFFDENTHLFFYTSDLDPKLIARKRDLEDKVIPSANSTMAFNLFKLGTLLDNHQYLEVSDSMLHVMSNVIIQSEYPAYYSGWNIISTLKNIKPYEIAILGKKCLQKLAAMKTKYIPNAVWLGGQKEESLALLKDRLVTGKTMIYVCQNKVCKFPVEVVDQALRLIE